MRTFIALLFTILTLGSIKSQNNITSSPLSTPFLNYLDDLKNGNILIQSQNDNRFGHIPMSGKLNFDAYYSAPNLMRQANISDEIYDMRQEGLVTDVKNQNPCGACWAFATYGSIESFWMKQGIKDNLSESNLKNCHGYLYDPCYGGGNMTMSIAYLARNTGPVSTLDDPYIDEDLNNGCTPYTPVAYVTEARFLPTPKDISEVKQYLIDYGALFVSFLWHDNNYYNESSEFPYTYYCEYVDFQNCWCQNEYWGHAVTLIGWDDTKETAGGTGAWICKNSWGAQWGEGGYFYISYNDYYLLNVEAGCEYGYFPGRIEYNLNSTVYCYDELGWTGYKYGIDYTGSSLGYENNDGIAYGLIKYEATKENQKITKVGTWINTYNTTVFIEIYKSFNGSNLTLDNKIGEIESESNCTYPGYYTFNLKEGIAINKGDNFYIKVKYNTYGINNNPIPVEGNVDTYTKPVIRERTCWMSSNGIDNWESLGSNTTHPVNLCINAYATGCDLQAELTPVNSVNLCEGKSVNLKATGGENITYQWLMNGTNITGGTNSSINISTAGIYTVKLEDASGCKATSAPKVIEMGDGSLTILEQPVNVKECESSNISFTVSACGPEPLSYQWLENGTDILDATNSAYSLNNITDQDGFEYSCIITDSENNSITTNTALLTILYPPNIITSPTTVTECNNNKAKFTIAANGEAPLSYQWQENESDLSNTGIYSGVNTAELIIADVTGLGGNQYRCVVRGFCEPAATSDNATLYVNTNTAETITLQPVSVSLCTGSSHEFTITTTGSNLSYQWQENESDITDGGVYSGSQTSTLSISDITGKGGNKYRCIVTTNEGCISISDNAILTEKTEPVINCEELLPAMCEGGNASFFIYVTGEALSYQWQENGINIIDNTSSITSYYNSTTSELRIENVIGTMNNNIYNCIITNGCGNSITSSSYVLTVYTKPIIDPGLTLVTGNQVFYSDLTVCAGYNFLTSFCANQIQNTIPSYSRQWWKQDFVTGLSSVAPFSYLAEDCLYLNPPQFPNSPFIPLDISEKGVYYCVYTNMCGSTTTNSVTLNIYPPPVILNEPTSASFCGEMTLTIEATDVVPLSYQWQLDYQDIPDATQSTYIATQAGTYRCRLDGNCTFYSTPFYLNIEIPINNLHTSGNSQIRCTGDNFSIHVTADNGNPIAYQWYKDDVILSGETSWQYNKTSISKEEGGNFKCILSNMCGTVTSDNISITVFDPPEITSQPSDLSLCPPYPSNVDFQITTTGDILSYRWRRGSSPLSNFGRYSGVYTTTLSISDLTGLDGAYYSCVITGRCPKSITTDIATLHLNYAPVISTQPISQVYCSGTLDNITLNVSADGKPLPSYQWYKDGELIEGASNSTFSKSPIITNDAGEYYCILTNSCGSVTSSVATITIDNPVEILNSIPNQSLCEGTNIDFTVEATGGNISYQWKKGATNISGATTSIYSINNIKKSDENIYTCIVSNTCSTTSINQILLMVKKEPSINLSPITLTRDIGGCAKYTLSPTGDNPFYYQWYKNNEVIPGATSQDYSFSFISDTDAGEYKCIISNVCGTATATAGTLVVHGTLSIQQPEDLTACAGTSVSFSFNANFPNLSFQWKKDGNNITGATNTLYSIDDITPEDAGSYQCIYSHFCDGIFRSKGSDAATLTVLTSPEITEQPQSQSISQSGTVSFSVTSIGSEPLSYQWYYNGGPIEGETNNSYTFTATYPNALGIYSCSITNVCGTVMSDGATLYTGNSLRQITGKVTYNNGQSTSLTNIKVIFEDPNNLPFVALTNGDGDYKIDLADNTTYKCIPNENSKKWGGADPTDALIINKVFVKLIKFGDALKEKAGDVDKTGNATPTDGLSISKRFIKLIPNFKQKDWLFDISDLNNGIDQNIRLNGRDEVKNIKGICTGDVNSGYHVPMKSSYEEEEEESSMLLMSKNNLFNYFGINTESNEVPACTLKLDTIYAQPNTDIILALRDIDLNNAGAMGLRIAYDTTVLTFIDTLQMNINIKENIFNRTHDSLNLAWINPDLYGRDIGNGVLIKFKFRYNGGSTTLNFLSDCEVSNIESNYFDVTYKNGLVAPCGETTITEQPEAVTACEGTEAEFSIGVEGTGKMSYQWMKIVDNESLTIEGATQSTYRINSVIKDDEGDYYCIVSNTCGNVTSDEVSLTVGTAPSTTLQSSGIDNTVTFEAVTTGTIPISYQWYKDDELLAINDDTQSTFTISSITNSDAGIYNCIASNLCGTTTSNSLTLEVFMLPVIIQQPESVTANQSDDVNFSITAIGTNLSYMWSKNGSYISNSTQTTFSLTSITSNDAGNYNCIVSNECGSVTSTVATLTVNSPPPRMIKTGGDDSNTNINTVNIYPNPNDGSFNMDIELKEDSYIEIEGYNVLGEKVLYKGHDLKKGLNSLRLRIDNARTGLYFITVKTAAERFYGKIMVK